MKRALDPFPLLLALALAGGVLAACGSSSPKQPDPGNNPPPTTSCTVPSDCPTATSACAEPVCTAGVCDVAYLATTTTCGVTGAGHCDGQGACLECTVDADCAQLVNVCAVSVACVDHLCEASYRSGPSDTVPQTPNDCLSLFCDQNRGLVANFDPSDVVTVTGDPCTRVACYQSGYDPVTVATELTGNLGVPCTVAGGGAGVCQTDPASLVPPYMVCTTTP